MAQICRWGMVLLLLSWSGAATAGETYYLLVFGGQQTPRNPDYSHSWAIFVKATDQPGQERPTLESHTISWMPRNLVVRTRALLPEAGVNLGYHETFQWAQENGLRTSLWGPYRIKPELYHLALDQIALLESGRVLYKAVDTGYPTDRVSNCIHAVSHVVEGKRFRIRVASPGWGEMASYVITRRLESWIIDPEQRHEWVAAALGLDAYPVIRRRLVNPRTGLFWSAVEAATGRRTPLGRGVIPPEDGSEAPDP